MTWLLVLKIVLAPCLVAGATLGSRRWGVKAGGVFAGLPVIAGCILLLYSLEQGTGFASQAALKTSQAVVCFAAFALTYSWISQRLGIFWSVIGSWLSYALFTLLLMNFSAGILVSLVMAEAALFLAYRFLPSHSADLENACGVTLGHSFADGHYRGCCFTFNFCGQ